MDEREVREERQRNRPETRRTGSRRRRNSRARRRRKLIRRILLFLVIIILVAAAGGFFIWKKYGPSKEKADLNKYYGLTQEEDLAVVINNRIAKSRTDGMPAGRIIDGQPYVEYSVVRDYINERFYWDPNENIMLYTLPNGNVSVTVGSSDYTSVTDRKSKNYVILKTEGRVAYIALPFVQEYTGMDFSVYENPNRVSITCGGQTVQTAVLKKDT